MLAGETKMKEIQKEVEIIEIAGDQLKARITAKVEGDELSETTVGIMRFDEMELQYPDEAEKYCVGLTGDKDTHVGVLFGAKIKISTGGVKVRESKDERTWVLSA